MDDLIAFLRAQLDADLRVARAALVHEGRDREHSEPLDWQRHVWEWKPSRVLVEVEAKRARIDLLAAQIEQDTARGGLPGFAEQLVLIEAQPLASRPGFKPEWRLA